MTNAILPEFYESTIMDNMDVDNVDNTDNMDVDNNYISTMLCGIPTQPQNKELVFPLFLRRDLNIMNDPNNKASKRTESLLTIEKWLVNHGTCAQLNPSIVTELQERMFNISPDALQNYLNSTSTLDAYTHDNLSCLVNAIYQHYTPVNSLESRIRERIKHWLPGPTVIGSLSASGYALQTSFNSYATQLFVIKVPRNRNHDTLIHEATIGLYVTNKMRHLLPNFMYIYGYTRCAPPILDVNNEIITWCSSINSDVSYLITENIIGGQDFMQFFNNKDLTYRSFQLIFLQIINALNQAFIRYRYTHNDLHYGNILIRKFISKIAVPYYDSATNIIGYIATQYVPTIIDYGNNSAKIGSQMIGKFGLAKIGIVPSEPFPMYDMYKLLCFLYESLQNSTNAANNSGLAIKIFLSEVFSVFGDGSINDRIKRRLSNPRNDYYQAPENLRTMTYDDYIKLLGPLLPSYFLISATEVVSQNIYLPQYNEPIDSCKFYKFFNVESGPATAFEYCQALVALEHNLIIDEDYRAQGIKWLNSKFNAELYFNSVQNDILDTTSSINTIIKYLHGNNMIFNTKQNLSNISYANLTHQKLLQILILREKITDMVSIIRVLTCSLIEQQSYEKHSSQLKELAANIEKWINIFEKSRLQVEKQEEIIQKLKLTPGTVNNFWFEEFSNLANQISTEDIDNMRIISKSQ